MPKHPSADYMIITTVDSEMVLQRSSSWSSEMVGLKLAHRSKETKMLQDDPAHYRLLIEWGATSLLHRSED